MASVYFTEAMLKRHGLGFEGDARRRVRLRQRRAHAIEKAMAFGASGKCVVTASDSSGRWSMKVASRQRSWRVCVKLPAVTVASLTTPVSLA